MPSRRRRLLLAAAGLTAVYPAVQRLSGVHRAMADTNPETVVYVSNAGGPSISMLAMDRASGALDPIEETPIPGAEQPSPSSMPLAVSPDRRFLYAALRSDPFTAACFAIERPSGRLRHLGNSPLEVSMAYITTDRTGRWLLCASYPAGKLTVNPIGSDGLLQGPPTQVIGDRPKAHCVVVDAANQHAYCAVLEQDLILQFNFDPQNGKLAPNSPPEIKTKPGAGPRHLAFHPSGRFLYLITETTATIGAYAIEASGALRQLQFLDMLEPGHSGPIAAADLHVTPNGHFLYGSERRTSSLVGFRIEPAKGMLTRIGHWPTETTPRGFAIDPRGRFLLAAGLDSNHLTGYAIGGAGVLEPAVQRAVGKMPNWIELVDLR